MKNTTRALLIFALTFFTFNSVTARKVLFIGVDGCRWDAVETANASTIDGLLVQAIYSGNGLTEYKTWSGTGWSNMLTGVWHTKHGVTDNSFAGSNYGLYPDFLTRAETFDSTLSTISIVHWGPLNTNIIQSADAEQIYATDLEVKTEAVNALNNDNPDILFVAFDDVDHAGHSFGFSPVVPEYIQAIEITDGYISEIITALHNRIDYINEDWLIVLTTDHGGIPSGHGGGTINERTIFNIYANDNFTSQNLIRIPISQSHTYNEAHFNAGSYAIPGNQSVFAFGTTQNFTIEFWVKASLYTGDPSFISNKDWNSGLNAGFVISAQQGQYWKVNIGDGTNRLDVQGGFLLPNEWHHLAVSFDRTGLMTAYEDGVVVGFDKMQTIGNIDTGLPLVINQDGTTTYGYDFDGSLKDIRIWNAVIPDSVLLDWATIPVTNLHPYYNQLLANWKCEDGAGNTLLDASSNANNCNITGTVNWNSNQTDIFEVFDYSGTTREPDNAVTALDWLCIPIQTAWNLDGKSRIPSCQSSSISSPMQQIEFDLSPNPISDKLNIVLGAPVDDKWEIVLFDFNGRIVFQESIPANQNRATIQFDQMSSGIYLLKIVEGKRYSTQTVIKE